MPMRAWVPPQVPAALAPLRNESEAARLTIPHSFPPVTPPRGAEPAWWPLNAAQQAALCSPARLLLYGGQSGGGKTDFLVGDAMQESHLPSLRGLLLRESLGEMDQLGDRMAEAYAGVHVPRREKAVYRRRTGGGQWIFPSGARIRYGYLSCDKDLGRYRGNPYTWLGIDESGLHPLHRVRQVLAWMSSVDPRLRARARFASNPGGVGHAWQMAVFLRNRCPLHFPADAGDSRPNATSVRAGKVYQGASWTWPPCESDLVRMTTAFFPASVTDNPRYGQEKIDVLMSQTPEIRMQLLHGCWCNAESLYFGFLHPEWMVAYPLIGDQWWWNHFVSIDYGFGNSSAAAVRFSVDPTGRVYVTGLILEKKMGSVDFAKKICESWLAKRAGEEKTRYLFVTLDPANDNHDGTGESNFEIMEGVFAQYGVPCIKSHKSPADNAQRLYHGLTNRLLVLTDGAQSDGDPKYSVFQAISTRSIDERRAVKKIHGDPNDDIYDAAAYGYNTWVMEAVKPERMKIAEKAEKMQRDGAAATDIARYNLQANRELRAKEEEQALGIPLTRRRIGRR